METYNDIMSRYQSVYDRGAEARMNEIRKEAYRNGAMNPAFAYKNEQPFIPMVRTEQPQEIKDSSTTSNNPKEKLIGFLTNILFVKCDTAKN